MSVNRSFNDINYSLLRIHLKKQPIAYVLSQVFYNSFAKFVGKHLRWSLFLSKLACSFITIETPAQVFSCECNEIFKNTFFYRKTSMLLHIQVDCFQQIFQLVQRNAFSFAQKQPAEVFSEKRCSRKFRDIHRKNLCWSLFLVKLQTFRPSTLVRRDFNIGIFLWVLRNFCGYFRNTQFEKVLRTASSVFNLLSH